MTNGMIAGLIFATALTLVVVPTLYVSLAERLGMGSSGRAPPRDA